MPKVTLGGSIDKTIKSRLIADIVPYHNNAKIHEERQMKPLCASIRTFGFVVPLLVNEQLELIAGHGRLQAAKRLGLKEVPTLTIRGLSKQAQHLLRLADNKIAETGISWSIERLQIEFDLIQKMDGDLEFELSGFSLNELNLSFDAAAGTTEPPEAAVPRVADVAVTRLGDVWRIKDHRLICGDATVARSYKTLLVRERADQVLTDPPYNVRIAGHVSGKGRAKHREFLVASGEMDVAQFRAFLNNSTAMMARFSRPGSLHYICMDWRSIADLLAAGALAYDELKNLCVWTKNNAGMGSLYRSQHELVAVFKWDE